MTDSIPVLRRLSNVLAHDRSRSRLRPAARRQVADTGKRDLRACARRTHPWRVSWGRASV